MGAQRRCESVSSHYLVARLAVAGGLMATEGLLPFPGSAVGIGMEL